jgi:hypothetical protein
MLLYKHIDIDVSAMAGLVGQHILSIQDGGSRLCPPKGSEQASTGNS